MNSLNTNTEFSLEELKKESVMGVMGTETQREVRIIDLSDFENRKYEIADQLWNAAVEIGFFQVANHGIPQKEIQQAFGLAEQFFALPREVKAQFPLNRNAGWESKAQIRPSTKTPDQKESYQITRPRMSNLWPTQQKMPDFKAQVLNFESQCWSVGMKILSCFAYKMGLAPSPTSK